MDRLPRGVRLPCKPQYVRVELDADMAPDGPMRGGGWPGRWGVLTFHYFGRKRLRIGERVCVNGGLFEDVFGTVLGRSWRYSGYTFGVRRTRRKSVTVQKTVDRTTEFEVA
jgi:hypothetical protein